MRYILNLISQMYIAHRHMIYILYVYSVGFFSSSLSFQNSSRADSFTRGHSLVWALQLHVYNPVIPNINSVCKQTLISLIQEFSFIRFLLLFWGGVKSLSSESRWVCSSQVLKSAVHLYSRLVLLGGRWELLRRACVFISMYVRVCIYVLLFFIIIFFFFLGCAGVRCCVVPGTREAAAGVWRCRLRCTDGGWASCRRNGEGRRELLGRNESISENMQRKCRQCNLTNYRWHNEVWVGSMPPLIL